LFITPKVFGLGTVIKPKFKDDFCKVGSGESLEWVCRVEVDEAVENADEGEEASEDELICKGVFVTVVVIGV
jgi:hypothetical protein